MWVKEHQKILPQVEGRIDFESKRRVLLLSRRVSGGFQRRLEWRPGHWKYVDYFRKGPKKYHAATLALSEDRNTSTVYGKTIHTGCLTSQVLQGLEEEILRYFNLTKKAGLPFDPESTMVWYPKFVDGWMDPKSIWVPKEG